MSCLSKSSRSCKEKELWCIDKVSLSFLCVGELSVSKNGGKFQTSFSCWSCEVSVHDIRNTFLTHRYCIFLPRQRECFEKMDFTRCSTWMLAYTDPWSFHASAKFGHRGSPHPPTDSTNLNLRKAPRVSLNHSLVNGTIPGKYNPRGTRNYQIYMWNSCHIRMWLIKPINYGREQTDYRYVLYMTPLQKTQTISLRSDVAFKCFSIILISQYSTCDLAYELHLTGQTHSLRLTWVTCSPI